MTAPPGARSGRAVARIDPRDFSLHEVAAEPLDRPIDVQFHPHDCSLWVLDFGRFEMNDRLEVVAEPDSGSLWRLS